MTVPLLSELRSKDKSTIYERLLILVEQGYLQKTYDKSWKLLGKPAIYSLAPKGIRALRDSPDGHFGERVLRNQYKNSSASLQLVDHSVNLFKLCMQLSKQYGHSIDLFTKAELARFDTWFIKPLPDLYVRKDMKDVGKWVHYQVEVVTAGTFTWMIKKRINAHQDWYDENSSEDWGFEDNYPTLLLLCGNASTEKRVHRLTDESCMDFEIWTTTKERLESGEKQIWLPYMDEDEQPELTGL